MSFVIFTLNTTCQLLLILIYSSINIVYAVHGRYTSPKLSFVRLQSTRIQIPSHRHQQSTNHNRYIAKLHLFLSTPNSNNQDGDTPSLSSSSSTNTNTLSNEEIRRYSRHLVLSDVGMVGQMKLKNSAVLMIGAGGLGSPILLYLAAAGIGHIGIVDADVVDESNLQRQIIHSMSSVGISKCKSAFQSIQQINPFVNVRIYEEEFTSNTAKRIITEGYSNTIPWTIVLDGSDNFPTKYLIKYGILIFYRRCL
jgi:hypothetical protein